MDAMSDLPESARSLGPMLESARSMGPMMAVSFSVCLSYIFLEPFKLKARAAIRTEVDRYYEEHLDQMEERDPTNFHWKVIKRLSEKGKGSERREKGEPKGSGENLISLFVLRVDRYVAHFGAAVSLLILAFWTGCIANDYLCSFASNSLLHITYWILLFFICIMSTFAILIHNTIEKMKQSFDYHSKQIDRYIEGDIRGGQMQKSIKQARLDSLA